MTRMISAMMLAALAFAMLVACATSPSKIQPAMVSKIQFTEMSCVNLDSELESEMSNLETLTGEQISARNWDIALNIILLPGFGALTGDNESEIAQSKGRIIAMREEYAERCVESAPEPELMGEAK